MAIVIVSTTVGNVTKFLLGKESRFLRDIHPDVKKNEKFQLPGDYMNYYTQTCKKLSRLYGMRVQFDTPDIYPEYTRTRFRYLEYDWRYGIVKGSYESTIDKNTLDTAVREFSEEVMEFTDREAFEDMNVVVHKRDLYSLNFTDPTNLCKTIAYRTNTYYGELFEMELRTWDEIQEIWKNLNVVSKRALEIITSTIRL